MAKKADNSSSFTLPVLLKSGGIINLFYLLIVLLLIKMIDGFTDGFSNPQLLQREYYFFYPELFEELPASIESIENNREDTLDGVNHDQPMWMASSSEDLGLMGTEETDTPYLMEELYQVQDDMIDVKTRLDVIGNEVGVQQPDGATCSGYTPNDFPPNMTHPCNSIADLTECDASEYCQQYNVDPAVPGSGSCGALMDTNSQAVEIDCEGEYDTNGGLIRYSCPWVCLYKNNVESDKVQGGFLLTESNRIS